MTASIVAAGIAADDAGSGAADPADRARHRRDDHRRRSRVAAADVARRSAAAMDRDVAVSLVTGRMVSSAMRFARELGLTGPIVGYQGGLIRAMPPPERPGSAGCSSTRPLAADGRAGASGVDPRTGLDPHVNHLERFILRADDPRAEDYSAFMGARAELVPDLIEAIDHPVTKILGRRRAAGAGRRRPAGPGRVRRARRRDDLAPALPRVRGAGRLEGPGRPAGSPGGCASRSAATLAIGDQWNDLEMIAEVGHGAAMPSAPPEVRAAARYVAPPLEDDGAARMIEQLVLASARGVVDAARLAARPPTRTRAPVTARVVADDARRARGGGRRSCARGRRRPAHRHGLRDRGRRSRHQAASSACSRSNGGRPTRRSCCCSTTRRRRSGRVR